MGPIEPLVKKDQKKLIAPVKELKKDKDGVYKTS
jgi:hypothetical protein